MFESSKGDGGEFKKLDLFARLLMGDTWFIVKMFSTLLFWLIGWSNAGVTLALRFGHGSRYINLLMLSMGFIMMNVMILIGTVLGQLNGYETAGMLWPVANLLYIPLAAARRLSAHRRLHATGIPGVEDGNSEFMGASYLFLLGKRFKRFSNPRFVYRWAEPALCFVIAYAVDAIDPGVGMWLWFCGTGLFLHNGVVIRQAYYRIQDVVDAQEQGEFVMDGMGDPEPMINQKPFTVSAPAEDQTAPTFSVREPRQ